jgi:hypothetical protein
MTKSATDVMEEIIFAAVIDAVQAMKAASKGMPNTLLRDLNAIHANVTRADLPADVQAAIQTNVRAAFTKLLKEGYSVAPRSAEPPRGAPMRDGPRPDRRPFSGAPGARPNRPDRRDPSGGRGPRPGGGGGPRPSGGGGKPGGGKPGGGGERGGRPPKKS